MASNPDKRKRRLISARDYNFDYKFNNEATSYDRIMTVLNKQQERIVAMLKKYTDDEPNTSYPTIQMAESEESTARNHSTLEERGFGLVKRRVDSSLPVTKKSHGRRGVYNLYDIEERLPTVKQTTRIGSKGSLSLGSSERRSKQEVIEEVYINKPTSKPKPRAKKRSLAPPTPLLQPET
jgi:hypothetical protein